MINLKDIEAASERIKDLILRTPMIPDPTGHGLYIKAEHLQKTGAFKLRGASNKVTVAVQEGATHVVTGSSGNHGQAVACVAQQLGIKATIVLPEDCPAVKVEGIRSWGGNVEFCGLTSTERLARAEEIVREQGAVFIPPFDDPYVQAGQGTIGLEILAQLGDVERVYVPIGGGGLIAGISTAIKESRPGVQVIGVEPALANDTYQSLQKGEIVDIGSSKTIADGLRASHPGSLTLPIIKHYVDDVVLVSEEEIREAFRYMFFERRQLVEPSGAVSVAAALRDGKGGVAVVSGGNVDKSALPGLLGDL